MIINQKKIISFLKKINFYQILFFSAIIFFILASFDMAQSDLWRDEAFTAKLVSGNLLDIIQKMAGDFGPFLHPLLVWFWVKIFGLSEFSLRSTSFLSTILALIFFRKLFTKTIEKNLASVLFLSSSLIYYYAVEARYYALLTFLVIAAYYYSLNFTKKNNQLWWVVFNTLLLYTHNLSVFIYATFALIVFIKNYRQKKLFNLLVNLILPVICYLPWIFVLIGQVKSLADNPFWLTFHPWYSLRDNMLALFFYPFDGSTINFHPFPYLEAIIILIMILVSIFGQIILVKKKNSASLLAFWLPLILIYLVSFKQALFYIRYIAFVYPFLVIFMTTFITNLKKKTLAIFLACLFFTFNLYIYKDYFYLKRKPAHKTVFDYITKHFPSYTLINDTEFTYFPCEYYHGNCYIAKEKKEIANVGLVLINENIALSTVRLLQFPSIVFISWDNDLTAHREVLKYYHLKEKTQVGEFYVYAFLRN